MTDKRSSASCFQSSVRFQTCLRSRATGHRTGLCRAGVWFSCPVVRGFGHAGGRSVGIGWRARKRKCGSGNAAGRIRTLPQGRAATARRPNFCQNKRDTALTLGHRLHLVHCRRDQGQSISFALPETGAVSGCDQCGTGDKSKTGRSARRFGPQRTCAENPRTTGGRHGRRDPRGRHDSRRHHHRCGADGLHGAGRC